LGKIQDFFHTGKRGIAALLPAHFWVVQYKFRSLQRAAINS